MSETHSGQAEQPVDPREYTVPELFAALMRDTDGNWPFEAAARLVGEHGFWLTRADFLGFVMTGTIGNRVWVGIDWLAVAEALRRNEFEAEEPDLNVLRIGAGLTPYGDTVSLGEVIRNQSPEAMRSIVAAIMHAGGYPNGV